MAKEMIDQSERFVIEGYNRVAGGEGGNWPVNVALPPQFGPQSLPANFLPGIAIM
jgi:hypothetical protein